jgi:hypothetical protein
VSQGLSAWLAYEMPGGSSRRWVPAVALACLPLALEAFLAPRVPWVQRPSPLGSELARPLLGPVGPSNKGLWVLNVAQEPDEVTPPVAEGHDALLGAFLGAAEDELEAAVAARLNECDYLFMQFLMGKAQTAQTEEVRSLGRA